MVQAKLIGVLRLLDDGEKDDKLIAVPLDSPFNEADNLIELNQKFPGIINIIEIWFLNYKGKGRVESKGFSDVDEARRILDAAIDAFTR